MKIQFYVSVYTEVHTHALADLHARTVLRVKRKKSLDVKQSS